MVGAATEPTVLTVFAAALLTALATGLGAMPLAFTKRASGSWLGVGNSIAASLMLGASVMLFYEGARSDPRKTLLGASVGLAAIAFTARWLNRRENLRFEALRGVQARTAVMIVAVMTVHSMAEGIGVGVAFGPGRSFGLLTALAIALHNIPEGLAISLVLVPRGVSVPRAAGWSVVTSLPQPRACRARLRLRRGIPRRATGWARIRGRRDDLDGARADPARRVSLLRRSRRNE